jgi:hypothetical protein
MRSPAQHPSRRGQPKAGPDLELELEPGAPPASGTTPRSSASGRGILGGSRLHEDGPAPSGGPPDALELDLADDGEPPESARRPLGPPPPRQESAASDAMLSLDDDVGSLDVGLDLGTEPVSAAPPSGPESGTRAAPRPLVAGMAASRTPPPSGVAAVAGVAVVVPSEVAALAAYGPEPRNILEAPVYAVRVLRRRAELRRLHRKRGEEHAERARAIREQIAALVDELLARADPAAVARITASLAEEKHVVDEQRNRLAFSAGAHAEKLGALERDRAVEEGARRERQRERSMAQVVLEDAMQKQARIEETLRRIDMQLTAEHEDARGAAGKDARFAPPEHAKRIAALDAEQTRVTELKQRADDAVDVARGNLRDKDRALRDAAERIAAVHRLRLQSEQAARNEQTRAYLDLRHAEDRRLQAYQAALARIGTEHPGLLGREIGGRVDELERAIASEDADLERHRLAIDAYAAEAMKRGIAVLGVLVVAVVAVLVMLLRVA